MPDIIARTRDLNGDPVIAGNVPPVVWSDQIIQDALDKERQDVTCSEFRELIGTWTIVAGATSWMVYYVLYGFGDWEADIVLINGALAQLTTTVQDYLTGHWTFAANQVPPVYVVGKTFDIYASARTLVLRWAALEARNFDIGTGRGETAMRSQKQKGLLALADQLAVEMRPRVAKLVRRDVYGAYSY